jgi:hypothetical protein
MFSVLWDMLEVAVSEIIERIVNRFAKKRGNDEPHGE